MPTHLPRTVLLLGTITLTVGLSLLTPVPAPASRSGHAHASPHGHVAQKRCTHKSRRRSSKRARVSRACTKTPPRTSTSKVGAHASASPSGGLVLEAGA
ncbi:MAG TPA: hypothetical protein VES65_09400, partial [Solirubrobacteraceae bacterium]|nr:hypothetical protein [Solirubrobacteraceae bacterium]